MSSVLTMDSSRYNYRIIRQFAIATVLWGIVGMLVGVVIAAQLIWPDLNIGPWFILVAYVRYILMPLCLPLVVAR